MVFCLCPHWMSLITHFSYIYNLSLSGLNVCVPWGIVLELFYVQLLSRWSNLAPLLKNIHILMVSKLIFPTKSLPQSPHYDIQLHTKKSCKSNSHFKFNISKTESGTSSHICFASSIPNLSKWYHYLLRSSEQQKKKIGKIPYLFHSPIYFFLSSSKSRPMHFSFKIYSKSDHFSCPPLLLLQPEPPSSLTQKTAKTCSSLIFCSWVSFKSNFDIAIKTILLKYKVLSSCDVPSSLRTWFPLLDILYTLALFSC